MSILIKNQDMLKEGEKYLLEIRHDGTVYDAIGQRVAAQAVQFESPWHRVEERLPKPGEYVLAWERQGFCVVDRYIDIDDGRWGLSNDGAIYTHWMPLPEPPKEDADGEQ